MDNGLTELRTMRANGWINRPWKHQMRARKRGEEGRLEARSHSQKGRPAGGGSEREEGEKGMEDKKEGTMEGIEGAAGFV